MRRTTRIAMYVAKAQAKRHSSLSTRARAASGQSHATSTSRQLAHPHSNAKSFAWMHPAVHEPRSKLQRRDTRVTMRHDAVWRTRRTGPCRSMIDDERRPFRDPRIECLHSVAVSPSTVPAFDVRPNEMRTQSSSAVCERMARCTGQGVHVAMLAKKARLPVHRACVTPNGRARKECGRAGTTSTRVDRSRDARRRDARARARR